MKTQAKMGVLGRTRETEDFDLRPATFSDQLRCMVLKVAHDYQTKETKVLVPRMNVPNMRGAVELATALDPDCRRISFIDEARKEATTIYERETHGSRWRVAGIDGKVRVGEYLDILRRVEHA